MVESIQATKEQGSTDSNDAVEGNHDNEGTKTNVDEFETFFEGNSGAAMKEFKSMIRCHDIQKCLISAQRLMEHLELKRIDRGSTTKDYKVKSLEQQWFSAKEKKVKKSDEMEGDGKDVHIERDSLVQINCKQGKTESLECYQVLAIFTKHYNKWYLAEEDKVKWSTSLKSKKVWILARMVSASGKAFKEVKLGMESK